MVKIALKDASGSIIDYAIVSNEDAPTVLKYSWHRYCKNGEYYAAGHVNGKTTKMHVFLMGNAPNGHVIDHINFNGLDNRRSNLRFATFAQNSQRRRGDNYNKVSSSYYGVSKATNTTNWRVICGDTQIGTFDSEIEAAKAYDTYALVKYGRYARTNSLISYDEVQHLSIEDCINARRKELPIGIQFYKNKYYRVRIAFEGKEYSGGYFKDLEPAIVKRDEIQQRIEVMKNENALQHFKKEIQRDDKGSAIISVLNAKGHVVANCIVDDNKWHHLMLKSWHLDNNIPISVIDGKKVQMRQYILETTNHVRNKNNNTFDNRIDNLIKINDANALQHRSKAVNKTSQYKGVSFDSKAKKKQWMAKIRKDGVTHLHKRYETEVEAARAYNEKAKELYGENAMLNEV
jgi:hypothetical protein